MQRITRETTFSEAAFVESEGLPFFRSGRIIPFRIYLTEIFIAIGRAILYQGGAIPSEGRGRTARR